VVLDGVPLDPERGSHPFLTRGDLGWVPSDGGLLVNHSLLENVALPLRFARNLGKAEASRKAQEWLERVGLGAQAHQRPHVPGDGQAWLASLARAAARSPQLWLVDRPGGSLDAPSRIAARAVLEEAAGDPEVTLVLVGADWVGEELSIEDGRVWSGRQP
jgi:molybdate transport system permease protein